MIPPLPLTNANVEVADLALAAAALHLADGLGDVAHAAGHARAG